MADLLRSCSSPQKIISNKEVKNSDKFFSPLVLNIASRENISLNTLEQIKGTGDNQRVTKIDLLKSAWKI